MYLSKKQGIPSIFKVKKVVLDAVITSNNHVRAHISILRNSSIRGQLHFKTSISLPVVYVCPQARQEHIYDNKETKAPCILQRNMQCCSLNLDLRSLLMLLMAALNDMFLHELETASSNLHNKDTGSNMK